MGGQDDKRKMDRLTGGSGGAFMAVGVVFLVLSITGEDRTAFIGVGGAFIAIGAAALARARKDAEQ